MAVTGWGGVTSWSEKLQPDPVCYPQVHMRHLLWNRGQEDFCPPVTVSFSSLRQGQAGLWGRVVPPILTELLGGGCSTARREAHVTGTMDMRWVY